MHIEEFARRVERLCDFLLDKIEKSDDRKVIEELREAAINVQQYPPNVLDGLDNFMRGLQKVSKES